MFLLLLPNFALILSVFSYFPFQNARYSLHSEASGEGCTIYISLSKQKFDIVLSCEVFPENNSKICASGIDDGYNDFFIKKICKTPFHRSHYAAICGRHQYLGQQFILWSMLILPSRVLCRPFSLDMLVTFLRKIL